MGSPFSSLIQGARSSSEVKQDQDQISSTFFASVRKVAKGSVTKGPDQL